jgi:hypothetical protein
MDNHFHTNPQLISTVATLFIRNNKPIVKNNIPQKYDLISFSFKRGFGDFNNFSSFIIACLHPHILFSLSLIVLCSSNFLGSFSGKFVNKFSYSFIYDLQFFTILLIATSYVIGEITFHSESFHRNSHPSGLIPSCFYGATFISSFSSCQTSFQ